ncbi:MAG: alanine racemase [Methylomicrobium sp.]|nr:alanine racemase [Methylomicrobium sp.]
MTPTAYAVINLDAVEHNLMKVHQFAPHAKIMAVIKANAYGHGMLRIAQALKPVDGFAVARVHEGIRLRQAGIQQRIAVLEGFTCEEELDSLIRFNLDAVVHSLGQVAIFEKNQAHEKIAIWIKVDSGMNRLGFKPDEIKSVYQRLLQCQVIKQPFNFMTHLANADDLSDGMTMAQITLFNDTVADLPGPRSVANSAGIIGWKASLADWVRPGVMLYGVSPFADKTGEELGLKPIMELHSRLIAVKPVLKGDTVGYGGTWVCERATVMGVVAIGYGDGYPRYAKTGTPVLVNGQRVPLIGRVSMDMITVDLASQPDAKPGDPVTLWGKGLAVEEIALCADTIPYTLLCGITQRVEIIEGRLSEPPPV